VGFSGIYGVTSVRAPLNAWDSVALKPWKLPGATNASTAPAYRPARSCQKISALVLRWHTYPKDTGTVASEYNYHNDQEHPADTAYCRTSLVRTVISQDTGDSNH
jgi:hypothetical protein